MLILFTGDGKGKTTAALGQAVRAIGRGKNVLMIQFIKGPWKSGEDFAEIMQKINPSTDAGPPTFRLVKMGLGFVGILGDTLPKEEHAKAAKRALHMFKSEMGNGTWDMIILDEINVAVSLELLTKEEVLESVNELALQKFVIFTGRGAPKEFIDRADVVTEMKEIKHPFQDGKLAKMAMEF